MKDWVITKRQLGLLFLVMGVVGFVSVLALEILRRNPDPAAQAIGPAQMLALVSCVVIAVVGLTLIPFGDRPA